MNTRRKNARRVGEENVNEAVPPTFLGSKVEEDPQGFIDEVFKVLEAMGVSSQEKAELAAY